jgi:hypothetical protein
MVGDERISAHVIVTVQGAGFLSIYHMSGIGQPSECHVMASCFLTAWYAGMLHPNFVFPANFASVWTSNLLFHLSLLHVAKWPRLHTLTLCSVRKRCTNAMCNKR